MSAPQTIQFSSAFLVYFAGILIVGLVCLYHKLFIHRIKNPLLAPRWNGSWINFGIFIWILFCAFFIVPLLFKLISPLVFGSLTDDLKAVVTGFSTHLLLALTLLYLLFKHPLLLGATIKAGHLSTTQAISTGIYHFFAAIPVVWTLNLFWGLLLLFLSSKGVMVEFKRQMLVDLFASSQSPFFALIVIFFSTIVAPFTEEMIFRVGLFRFIKTKFGQITALVVTAALFATLHFHFLSVVPLFVLGILLARSYEATGHPLTPITFHACFNLNTLMLLFLQPNLTYF